MQVEITKRVTADGNRYIEVTAIKEKFPWDDDTDIENLTSEIFITREDEEHTIPNQGHIREGSSNGYAEADEYADTVSHCNIKISSDGGYEQFKQNIHTIRQKVTEGTKSWEGKETITI